MNSRHLKCYICGRELVDSKRKLSFTYKSNFQIRSIFGFGFGRNITDNEVNVFTCLMHPEYFLIELNYNINVEKIKFDRDSLKYIKSTLNLPRNVKLMDLFKGDCKYYNIYYSKVQRLQTFLRRIFRPQLFSANMPLDSLILLISSETKFGHFLLYGIFEPNTQNYLIVNIIKD